MDVKTNGFDEGALAAMCAYNWPGNVRELKNIVERMLVLHGDQEIIRAEFLPPEFGCSSANGASAMQLPEFEIHDTLSLEEAVNRYERQLVEKALEESNGVQTRAAEMLGTTRRILKYRMEKLNIDVGLKP